MSAQVLREAAALMRSRAEAATPGPWTPEPVDGDVWSPGNRERVCQTSSYAYAQDATHIASWHPAVALAVADWLEDAAATVAWSERPGAGGIDPSWPALAVANAYLASPPH